MERKVKALDQFDKTRKKFNIIQTESSLTVRSLIMTVVTVRAAATALTATAMVQTAATVQPAITPAPADGGVFLAGQRH